MKKLLLALLDIIEAMSRAKGRRKSPSPHEVSGYARKVGETVIKVEKYMRGKIR